MAQQKNPKNLFVRLITFVYPNPIWFQPMLRIIDTRSTALELSMFIFTILL